MFSLSAYSDFETATTDVLNYLHSRLGFQLWMVTRTQSDDWIVLSSNDHGYDVASGDVFRWTDSFCARMVENQGPRIAPRSDDVPAYATAPIGDQVPIGSYVGVPLNRLDGELFGTLCAIDPMPMPNEIIDELPLIEMMARLLTTILENELKAVDERRRAEQAKLEAMTDRLTGLYNRRGWDELLSAEDRRCRRYGHNACVFSIDLDDLKAVNDEQGHSRGDELLCGAAAALKSISRETDVVARIGGDEFAMLAVECDLEGAHILLKRLEEALLETNISASIGIAMRRESGSLVDAFDKADQKMYESKNRRKASRRSSPFSE